MNSIKESRKAVVAAVYHQRLVDCRSVEDDSQKGHPKRYQCGESAGQSQTALHSPPKKSSTRKTKKNADNITTLILHIFVFN